jgi:hypothetical protein
MNAKPETPDEPSVVGVRVRPAWSIVLYALLVLSAGIAFYAQRSPDVDPVVAQIAPWFFLAFALGFSVYRIALVAVRRYSPFKAFIQIFLAALFFLLLLFPRVQGPQAAGLLGHRDPQVRALAAEVAGWRGDQSQGGAVAKLLDDPSPEVRAAAHAALIKLNGGLDIGDQSAVWGKRFP